VVKLWTANSKIPISSCLLKRYHSATSYSTLLRKTNKVCKDLAINLWKLLYQVSLPEECQGSNRSLWESFKDLNALWHIVLTLRATAILIKQWETTCCSILAQLKILPASKFNSQSAVYIYLNTRRIKLKIKDKMESKSFKEKQNLWFQSYLPNAFHYTGTTLLMTPTMSLVRWQALSMMAAFQRESSTAKARWSYPAEIFTRETGRTI